MNTDPKMSAQPCGCDPGLPHFCEHYPRCTYGRTLVEAEPQLSFPAAMQLAEEAAARDMGLIVPAPTSGFAIKDSGVRAQYESGMVRDTDADKIEYHRVTFGPMFARYARHLTVAARDKYRDDPDGTPNWMKARTFVELARYRASAFRHFIQWFIGKTDEDHASAVYFNINGAEYVKERLNGA